MSSTHNLNIETYSLYEILGLFNLTPDTITYDTMKEARKKVLFMHPDKSRLPPEYFLFYKKAFEMVVRMYENTTRTTQEIDPNKVHTYAPEKQSDISRKQIQKTMSHMTNEQFQEKFNDLFERHSTTNKNRDSTKNDWFTNETKELSPTVNNANDLTREFERMKTKAKETGMTRYTGVVPLMMTGNANTSGLYEEDGENDNQYISSDPFSKLKFDDLRKVHKDQTIMSVSESDMNNITQYRTVEEYQRTRHDVKPMERSFAEQQIAEENRIYEEQVRKRQYKSQLRSAVAEQQSKEMLGNFLRLT